MRIDDLSVADVNGLSDEEVALWFAEVRRIEEAKQMRTALKNWLDIRNTERESRTIKLGGD